jgi:hypothetical protein
MSKTVYLVVYWDYDGMDVINPIYTSKIKAEKRANELSTKYKTYDVTDYELDETE